MPLDSPGGLHIILRTMPRLRPSLRLLAVVLLLYGSAAARDIAVVVQKTNPNKTVALADLAKMAKGATKKWPDGRDVTIVMKDPSAADMRLVVQKVFGMTVDEVKALIASLNQARKNTVIIAPSDDVLVKTVEATPGSIGLVDVFSITSAVSVVKVDGKSPLEPGYVLHGQ